MSVLIIWINGTFGVGKTSTAAYLNQHIKNAYLYDPELVGTFLRIALPPELHKEDFQDHEEWRAWNFSILKKLATESSKTIIVPMTLTNVDYFGAIIGRLREENVELRHFTLLATPETIRQRLVNRDDGDNTFALSRIERNLELLSQPRFQKQIDTEKLTIAEVGEFIMQDCRLR